MSRGSSNIWLFLIGLGSVTQFHFVGSLGISELPMFLSAPFIFLLDYKALKRDGFMPFVWLTILTCVGCVISSLINKTPNAFFVKGLAQPYSIFAVSVVLHRFLRRNLNGLKWFILGVFLSSVISIFVFQQETFTGYGGDIVSGDIAREQVMNYPLFWSSKVRQVLVLPTTLEFLKVPTLYSVGAAFISGIVYLLFSGTSGRAAALTAFAAAVLLVAGTKSRRRLRSMGRHIVLLMAIGVVALFLFKVGYSSAARSGLLGYEAQQKYFNQTKGGAGILQLIMAGRMEFFCGVMACLDHPFVGFGPRAEDTGGYAERFLSKYGSAEDYVTYLDYMRRMAERYGYIYKTIPAHSYIAMFWIYYGIFGLILWIYVLYLFYMYLRKYAATIPQWYGYLALSIPSLTWDVFFSPYGGRVSGPCVVVCILFAKAVYDKRLNLPFQMEEEARKHD